MRIEEYTSRVWRTFLFASSSFSRGGLKEAMELRKERERECGRCKEREGERVERFESRQEGRRKGLECPSEEE